MVRLLSLVALAAGLLQPALASEPPVPPRVESVFPLPSSVVPALPTVEVVFTEAVTGVEAGDLLMNGVPGTNLIEIAREQYLFEFPEPAAGPVRIEWAANHGILGSAGLPFSPEGWTYDFQPGLPLARVAISEFLAENDDTLNDENGDSSDWLELFNPAELPVDLEGCFLSNDPGNPARWRLPAISLPANGYLVIFASEKNRTNPAAKLHANFKIAKDGGYLSLSDPRTNLISAFVSYPAQRKDVSFGRERSNPAILGYFPKPTPGSANTGRGAGYAPDVAFSRDGGTFATPFELVLSTASTNATIRYSIGKNLPSELSNVYTAPLRITNSMQVRARAFERGLLPGDPHSESFVMLSNTVLKVTSDLPIVILDNYGAGAVPTSGEQFLTMQVFEPKHGVASLTNAPDLSQRARFRKRGSSTESLPKSSFALETWDEFGDDEKVDLLGMPAESDWVFYAPNGFEPVLIHNPFMYQLSRDIGRYASRTRFVEVYLNTRGGPLAASHYQGIYIIEEKIKRGPDRVDVDGLEPEHLKLPEVSGGYMLKIDRSDPGDSSFSAGSQNMNYVDPKGAEIRLASRDPQEQYIRGYFNQFGTVLFGANFRDPVDGYVKYIDVASWIDHHILNVLAFNVDALRLSTYLYKPRNGRIEFGPIWDFDRALGSTDGRDANPRVWSNGTEFFRRTGEYPWWGRLFQDPDFYQKWIDRWEELRRNQLSQTNLNRLIDSLAGEVRAAQPREQARWRVNPRGGSYNAEVTRMKNYLRDRAGFIEGSFVRPPVLSLPAGPILPGAVLSIAPSAGSTIYYTLDGRDPRLPGGAVSPEAAIYTGPISLAGNARVVARARNPLHNRGPLVTNSPWSGLVAASYVVETPKLALTEIMYHPAAPAAGSFTNTDFEFIELKNFGAAPLDLAGVSVSGGIGYVFSSGVLAPDGYLLLVKNRLVFESRYGGGLPVAGEFSGSLNSAGDRIRIDGPLGEPILDYTFDDGTHPITDGPGFSLVPATEGSTASWRASAALHGSPGRADPDAPVIPPILVNEILAAPAAQQLDAVELYNPTEGAVQIAGWYLTDDFDLPKKYRFPAGTVIPAGGYRVFDETAFNSGAGAFALGAKSDAIYLFSAGADGELTGYARGFQFGASTRGVTFGRWTTSDGRDVFPAQTHPTLGQPNAGPAIAPILVTELMFNPARSNASDNTLDEFVEISNLSPAAVSLFDPAAPGNAWRVRGGVGFDLPAGIALAPRESILLVGFDPLNSVFAAGFRTRLEVPSSTRIFGPFSGQLGNSGDRIRLLKPEPGEAGDIPYSVVEEFAYSADSPWPRGAAATGNSIQRLGSGFADDPISWRADLPTPGSATRANPVFDADQDGLPGVWEMAHGLNPNDPFGDNGPAADPDHDGLTNLQEFLAGTDPSDPASRLKLDSVRLGEGVSVIRFLRAEGISYSVFFRDSLAAGSWLKLADVEAGNAGPHEVPDRTPAAGHRFYRVVTPKQ